MPRKLRKACESGYYHFITRGVNKKKIFHGADDFSFYKACLKEYKDKFSVKIHHYCLMTNHTHLIVSCEEVRQLSQFAHFLQRRYAYYYCRRYHWAEQVFRQRFVSLPIENESYLLECGRYIERNPLDAFLVKDLRDYEYSSYHHYAFGNPDDLIDDSPLFATLGQGQEERMMIYRFNVLHQRDSELEGNKALRRLRQAVAQPVPF